MCNRSKICRIGRIALGKGLKRGHHPALAAERHVGSSKFGLLHSRLPYLGEMSPLVSFGNVVGQSGPVGSLFPSLIVMARN